MPNECHMCKGYVRNYDAKFRRYCSVCTDYRRANGMRRVERACLKCERKVYPMERELTEFVSRGSLCPGCYREDLRAKGGIPIVKRDKKGREFEALIAREKATPEQIEAYERGMRVVEEMGLQNRYDRPEVV